MSSICTVLRLACVAALAAAAACTSFGAASFESLTPQRDIKVEFPVATTLRLACAGFESGAIMSTCAPDTIDETNVMQVEGRVREVHGDSMLVTVRSVRDAENAAHGIEPPRTTWLARRTAVVQSRHTDTGRTIALVGLIVITTVVVVAAVAASQSHPAPAPKPTAPITWC